MPALLDQPPVLPCHLASDDTPAVLRRIEETTLNLCIWRRSPLSAASPAIETILASAAALELDLRAPDEAQITAAIRPNHPTVANSSGFPAFVEDIVQLASLFADLAGTRHPRVRLERVEDDGCALFHSDTLRMRMLCTYAGPGTQWLENSNVRRDQLGSQGRSIHEANAAIFKDATSIRSIANWHVAVFKGRAWSEDEDNSLIHRSAPVRHRGEYRLRLCIDLPNNCAC